MGMNGGHGESVAQGQGGRQIATLAKRNTANDAATSHPGAGR